MTERRLFPVKKRVALVLAVALSMLLLAACGGGNVGDVEIPDRKPSEIYSDADIEAAFETVKAYFSKEFGGCTLKKLYYPGDGFSDEFGEWAAQYDADEAIVILSSFDVDASGGDGSLEPNSTYEDWEWVLVRSAGGQWEHVTHGYG